MKNFILFPCYNNGKLLRDNLPSLFAYLRDNNINAEIVVANDGSTDDTLEILNSINDITVYSYGENKGKGGAVQYGILNLHANDDDLLIMMDCDFATRIDAIKPMLDALKNYDVVIGSRYIEGSVLPIKRSNKRRFISKSCNILVNSILHLHVKDSQCGFKGFKYGIVKQIALLQKVFGWLFDAEYLYIAKLNHISVKEIAVYWSDQKESSVHSVVASASSIKELFKIRRNKKHYTIVEN